MNYSFADVLIVPQFSTVKSRADVDTSVKFGLDDLRLGIISSNMDTVTGPEMSKAMLKNGAQACLHRFQSIGNNVLQFVSSSYEGKAPWVSIGLGANELERATALLDAGAKTFLIDVAHGATMEVVFQTKALRNIVGKDKYIIVGNFATKRSVQTFLSRLGDTTIDAIKVGIGGGSACTTRIVTGCGVPTLASIIDCKSLNIPIIADGGMRDSGDIAKAIAAGASAVMLGRMLAGAEESPGQAYQPRGIDSGNTLLKEYRGSASEESYKVQGKEASHRTPEGESFVVPYTGPVADTLQQIEAGLRSSMSYVGAHTLSEFRQKAQFIQITNAGIVEGKAHGKL